MSVHNDCSLLVVSSIVETTPFVQICVDIEVKMYNHVSKERYNTTSALCLSFLLQLSALVFTMSVIMGNV